MRIALVSSSTARSGAAASFAKLAAGLEARGHEVRRLAPAPGARGLVAVWGIVRRPGPDVVLADQPRDAALAAAATVLREVRIIYRYNRTEGRRRAGRAERLVASGLAGCIYQSLNLHEQALTHEPWLASVPAWVVPNGFDTEWFAPGPVAAADFRARHRVGAETRVVLTVGALAAGKGHDVAIDALGPLRRDGLDLIYLLAGDGPRAPELHRRAAAARVPLRELGWLDPEELRAAYRATDLVLHPSDHEIFPNAVGEAMACACAVVATSVGGTPDLVGADTGAGLLVPPRDAVATARAVGMLLADPERRRDIGLAARARIRSEFPLARMVEGTERALTAPTSPEVH